ncbi:nuclear pore glycoprotein p62-like [Cyclopterus lumpus]|uniref:nuclear pore glycoprotein p62-like n=1 Tax=Cyclopterus lumpus TaxID=8103 RepID=UPI001486251A|nr:nuclear pore glycoprotein p62-like [Cyclopterus lumpus]
MSGGFNFGKASTGFSFGAQKPAVAAPSTGFGMTSAMPAATGGGFAFGTPTQAAPNPTGSFSFGTPAKSTAAGGGFSFGTPTAPFGMVTPQPAAAPPQGLTLGTAVAPAPGSGFTMATGLSAQTAAPAGGGFAFGTPSQALPQPAVQLQPAAPPTAATVMATTGAGVPSFGGFGFGSTKVQATTAAPVAAPIAAPGGGFSFGNSTPSNLNMGIQPQTALTAAGTSQGATAAAATVTAAATTTAAGGGLAFMLKPLGAATITSAPAPAATVAAAITGAPTALTLGLKPLTDISIPTTSTVTTLSTTTAPPVMTYAQLEGLINKWSLELEDQERHFLQQATQVNTWDRMLVENGEKITALHKEMEKVKLDQRRLNQELDFILSQQKELEDLLCPLEESVKDQSGTIYMQNADKERERTYKFAENVDAQLKRMSQDLKEIIEHLNTSSGPADTSDPLQQICKILNTHMDSLQWIDQNSVLLQRRVEEVSKLCDNQRKDQEKTFRLTFD